MATAAQPRLLRHVLAIVAVASGLAVVDCANSNNNGNLTLDDVPSDHVYVSTGEYDEGSFPLPTTWGLVDSFLHTISPAPPPYDLVNGLLSGSSQLSIELLTGSISQLTGNLLGFVICFVVGCLFVVIFPLVAMCFCCCRCCCGNCGGKLSQKQGDYDRIKRVVFGFLLTVCLGFIMGGVATAFCVNTFTSQTVATLPSDVVGNIDDMVNFVTYTLEEINYTVIDQLDYTLAQVSQDLVDIDQLVGVPVMQELATNVQPAIDAIYPLDTSISNTYNGLVSINTTQDAVETLWEQVETMVDQALIDINTACAACLGCCAGASWPVITGLSMNADWRDINIVLAQGTFPQTVVDDSITAMESVNSAGLASAADKGADSFNNLPETLKNTTQADINAIVSTIDNLNGNIASLLAAATGGLSGITDPVEDAKGTINSFIPIIETFDPYRSYALIGFYSVLLVIAFMFLCGLVLGVAGYKSDVEPTRRGGVSNCGGICMMVGVYFAFFFLIFFMIFTMLLFIVGGPLDRLFCDPVQTGELFSETIDKPNAIVPGYYLGQTLFQDGNISLTISGMLEDCENDRAVYEAFQLANFINISSLLNFQQFIPDIGSQFANVTGDLTNVNILTAETRQILIDFRDSPADDINWTFFKNELAKNLTNDVNDPNDLSVVAALLNTFALTLSVGDSATFQGLATNLSDIQTNYIAPLLTQRDSLNTYIVDLEMETSGLDTLVNATIDAADAAQSYLSTTGPTFIAQEVVNYQDRILGYPDQFVNYALDQLQTEIGKCRPVYNLWTSLINSFCRGFLETVNALWLIMGWCVFFLIPSCIFAVKLAKHYRRMEFDDYGGQGDMEMMVNNGGSTQFGSNKVAPSYA